MPKPCDFELEQSVFKHEYLIVENSKCFTICIKKQTFRTKTPPKFTFKWFFYNFWHKFEYNLYVQSLVWQYDHKSIKKSEIKLLENISPSDDLDRFAINALLGNIVEARKYFDQLNDTDKDLYKGLPIVHFINDEKS